MHRSDGSARRTDGTARRNVHADHQRDRLASRGEGQSERHSVSASTVEKGDTACESFAEFSLRSVDRKETSSYNIGRESHNRMGLARNRVEMAPDGIARAGSEGPVTASGKTNEHSASTKRRAAGRRLSFNVG